MKSLIALTATSLLTLAPVHADDSMAKDIVDTAVDAGSFGTLATALKSAELVEALKGDGPFTVFAPTDDAFAKLPKETLAALLLPENKGALVDVLTYHVVSGTVSAQQAIAAGKAATLQKGEVSFRIDKGRLLVNDSAVTSNDIGCSNGVIHVIDTVLLPPGGLDLRPEGRLIIGIYSEKPSKALAEHLQIDRDKTMLLTDITSKGPAEKAGLRKYDVITAIGDRPATDADLKAAKESAGFGGELHLALIRRGKPMNLTVKVGIDTH